MALLFLGRMVNYQPADNPNALPLAAMIIGGEAGGTADLRVFLGFGQGTMDLQGVSIAADESNPTPGTWFSPLQYKEIGALAQALIADPANTSVVLQNPTSAVVGDVLRIDQEEMTVTSTTGAPTNVTVTRGSNGTTVATHAQGAIVLIGVQ